MKLRGFLIKVVWGLVPLIFTSSVAWATSATCEDIATNPSAYYGQELHVVCTYVSAKRTSKAVFLNSRSDWKNGFSLVLWNAYAGNFADSPETTYLNRVMVVSGTVQQYKVNPYQTDRPQILLQDSDQLIDIE